MLKSDVMPIRGGTETWTETIGSTSCIKMHHSLIDISSVHYRTIVVILRYLDGTIPDHLLCIRTLYFDVLVAIAPGMVYDNGWVHDRGKSYTYT